MKEHTLKILTYNIHKGFSPGNVKFNLPEIKKNLDEINPDLLFLQEVIGFHKRKAKKISNWPKCSQTKFISETNWPFFFYGKNAFYRGGHHGNAILSKFGFVEIENIPLRSHARFSRGLLHGVIKIPQIERPIHLICAHLGLSKRNRKTHISLLSDRINKFVLPNDKLILAGDFNDWRREDTEQFKLELNLDEVFKVKYGDYAKTYPAIKPLFYNDRIYFRGLKLIATNTLNDSPWKTLSDHIPIMAIFGIKG